MPSYSVPDTHVMVPISMDKNSHTAGERLNPDKSCMWQLDVKVMCMGAMRGAACMQGGLLGMVPFDPMGQISDKNRQSEVRNGRCCPAQPCPALNPTFNWPSCLAGTSYGWPRSRAAPTAAPFSIVREFCGLTLLLTTDSARTVLVFTDTHIWPILYATSRTTLAKSSE